MPQHRNVNRTVMSAAVWLGTAMLAFADVAAAFGRLIAGGRDNGVDPGEQPAEQAPAIEGCFEQLPVLARDSPVKRRLPQGVGRRTHGHCYIMRQAKEAKRRKLSHARETAGLNNLADAWNSEVGLRQGDRVHVDGQHRELGFQGGTWSHDGLCKLAWKQVGGYGRCVRGRAGVGESRRGLDAIAIMAAAFQILTERRLQAFLDSLDSESLHLSRHFDATPVLLGYGSLQAELQSFARYLVPDESDPRKNKSVDWETFKKHCPRACALKGTLEVMAMEFTVASQTRSGSVERRRVLMPPSILGGTSSNASVTWSAIDGASPAFNTDGLRALAARFRLVTLTDGPDNSTVNGAVRKFVGANLPENVLFCHHGCTVHVVHRVLTKSVNMTQLTGDVHAVHRTMNHHSYRIRMLQAAKELCDELLILPGPPPTEEYADYAKEVLRHTMSNFDQEAGELRDGFLDRPDDEVVALGAAFSARRRGAQKLLKYLNGDWRSQRLVHYENNCCLSDEAAKENVFAAICDSHLLQGFSSTTPSPSRWGSTTGALADQCLGAMVHRILPRCFAKAFPRAGQTLTVVDEEDDERIILKRKSARATRCVNDTERLRTHAIVSWIAAPIDHLWLKIQWLDARPGTFTFSDFQHEDINVFQVCIKEVSAFLMPPPLAGKLRPVFLAYASSDEVAIKMVTETQQIVLQLVSQLYWRSLVYSTWPYRLTCLVDERFSKGIREACFTEFWEEPECCLDPHFGAKVGFVYTPGSDPCILGALSCSCDLTSMASHCLITGWVGVARMAGGRAGRRGDVCGQVVKCRGDGDGLGPVSVEGSPLDTW